jgi:hypothetical protein
MRTNRKATWMIVGVGTVLLGLAIAQRVAAEMVPERTTYLTFTRTVRVPGATLNSGTYIFELVDSFAAPGVVRVSSRDRKVSYFMGFTKAVERPRDLRPDMSVSFGEAAAGAAPPIDVWWPIGERTGRKFVYVDR